MVGGLTFFSLGIAISLRANIGYAPWEVFHAGVARASGLSFGTASIIVGILVAVIVTALGEKLGLGSIFSMTLTGVLIDIMLESNIIPASDNMITGVAMLLVGIAIVSTGSCYYLRSAFGSGPRDNLMVVLNRRTKLPVGVCRSAVELTVTLAGWLLGGMVGIGTVISVIAIGLCIQLIFGIMKFDPASVRHETLLQSYRSFAEIIRSRGREKNPR
jgi:uncharacterized membrane protein YczE